MRPSSSSSSSFFFFFLSPLSLSNLGILHTPCVHRDRRHASGFFVYWELACDDLDHRVADSGRPPLDRPRRATTLGHHEIGGQPSRSISTGGRHFSRVRATRVCSSSVSICVWTEWRPAAASSSSSSREAAASRSRLGRASAFALAAASVSHSEGGALALLAEAVRVGGPTGRQCRREYAGGSIPP
jgi:hypothetical protein